MIFNNFFMKISPDLNDRTMADAWEDLKAHADAGLPLQADAYRLAFNDPEFLLRRDTRGVRLQLEMLKPDLGQLEAHIHHTIVVFGGARFCEASSAQARLEQARAEGDQRRIRQAERLVRNAHFYDEAREFANLVARHSASMAPEDRLYICTGGGPGVMEAANRGAHDAGAPSVGLNITLPHEQSGNAYVTPSLSFKFHYFAIRKMHFMMRAKALVAFPGGFGTLDELFETLTLVQTKKAQLLPIILFGSAYWRRLINFEALVEEGAVSEEDLDIIHFVDEPRQAWDIIAKFYRLEKT